jgi:hypothetical protein
MKNRPVAVLFLCFALAFGGCAARVKTVTNLPPGVTQTQAQNWDSAVQDLSVIANATSTARQTVIDLNKAGLFPDGNSYVTTLQILGKIDQLQLAASAVLKQSPGNFSDSTKAQVKDYMQQISAQILTLNTQGVTGIKDQTSLQKVNGLIATITGAVALVLSF